MYRVFIETLSGEVYDYDSGTLSKAVAFANNSSREGDKVQIFEVIDGLCGPEFQELILEYIEDGWESYDT